MTELELLIAEQAKDMATGDRVYSFSVDQFPSGADVIHAPRRQVASDPRHGLLGCYTKLRCRCEKCRQANAEYQRDWKSRRRATRSRAERDLSL